MAIITVNDANILIDLLQLEVIEDLLNADLELHSTNVVVAEHLDEQQNEALKRYIAIGKITIKQYETEDLLDIIDEVHNHDHQLSPADCSVLHCSQATNAILLSSDKRLVRLATQQGIEAHGVLWIFDMLVEKRVWSKAKAVLVLNRLMEINTWLPKAECENRLRSWTL